jgi:SAM-dependent methyltransferase
MRRIHFIELHDQPWFPGLLRDEVTDALQFGMSFLRAYTPVAPLIRSLLDSTGASRVVDICSGGGGPWLELSAAIQRPGRTISISLTDKHPNLMAFQNISSASGNLIEFQARPIDAMKVPPDFVGVRTIFTSFHHFAPSEARALLRDAAAARQAIGVFEITSRSPAAIAFILPWTLLALFFAPFIRPFRWSRLLWTYLLPVIPLVLLFDGTVSCLRSYRVEELEDLARSLGEPGYRWTAGAISGAAGMPITYLIGEPEASCLAPT